MSRFAKFYLEHTPYMILYAGGVGTALKTYECRNKLNRKSSFYDIMNVGLLSSILAISWPISTPFVIGMFIDEYMLDDSDKIKFNQKISAYLKD